MVEGLVTILQVPGAVETAGEGKLTRSAAAPARRNFVQWEDWKDDEVPS